MGGVEGFSFLGNVVEEEGAAEAFGEGMVGELYEGFEDVEGVASERVEDSGDGAAENEGGDGEWCWVVGMRV